MNGITHNEALRQGATEPMPGAIGRTVLVDWQCHAGRVRQELLRDHRLDIFHPDGIHPNVLGQLQLVGLVLDAIGVPVERTQAVERIAASVPGRLAHDAVLKSETWKADAATSWVRRLLAHPRACHAS